MDAPPSISIAKRPLSRYLDFMAKGEPFSFSRWNDGEWIALMAPNARRENRDGHAYFPEMSSRMRSILRTAPPYELATCSGSLFGRLGDDVRRWLAAHSTLDWSYSNVLKDASLAGELWPFFDMLKQQSVIHVGPQYLRDAGLEKLFQYDAFVDVPARNCFLKVDETIRQTEAMIRDMRHRPITVLITAGMPGVIIVDRLWDHVGDLATLFDVGSAFNSYLGCYCRSFHRREALANEDRIQAAGISFPNR